MFFRGSETRFEVDLREPGWSPYTHSSVKLPETVYKPSFLKMKVVQTHITPSTLAFRRVICWAFVFICSVYLKLRVSDLLVQELWKLSPLNLHPVPIRMSHHWECCLWNSDWKYWKQGRQAAKQKYLQRSQRKLGISVALLIAVASIRQRRMISFYVKVTTTITVADGR